MAKAWGEGIVPKSWEAGRFLKGEVFHSCQQALSMFAASLAAQYLKWKDRLIGFGAHCNRYSTFK